MQSSPDLNAYFERIGYSGSRAPTLETLRAIQLHHAQTIPFESLDPFLRRPVRLDLPALEQKLIHQGRGGYCFEHNRLLSDVLRALGFRVSDLGARVIWNLPEGSIRSRSHMVLRVELADGPYLVDVGFGGQTPTAPLLFVTGIEQPTPHEPFRLIEAEGDYFLQTRVEEAWKPLYRFDLQRQYPIDYEVSSWYLCHFPDSYFRNNLIAARPTPGGRYGLFNNQLAIHRLHRPSQMRTLGSAAEIRSVLEDVFEIRLPDDPALEASLERAAQPAAVPNP